MSSPRASYRNHGQAFLICWDSPFKKHSRYLVQADFLPAFFTKFAPNHTFLLSINFHIFCRLFFFPVQLPFPQKGIWRQNISSFVPIFVRGFINDKTYRLGGLLYICNTKNKNAFFSWRTDESIFFWSQLILMYIYSFLHTL